MIKYLTLMILGLIAHSSSCQVSYPRKLIYKGDTVIAITVDQSKKVNRAFLSAGYYKEVSDSMDLKICILEEKAANDSCIIQAKDTIIRSYKSIVDLHDQAQIKLENDYNELSTRYSNSKKWGKIKSQGLGGTAILVLLLILIK